MEIPLEPQVQESAEGLLRKVERADTPERAQLLVSMLVDVAQVSSAISAKRQADALEGIAMAVHDIYMILRERG
jgi:hypothetical protein